MQNYLGAQRMKCRAKNKAGQPCGAPAVGETDRCLLHSGKAAELGSKGGHRRSVFNPEQLKDFAPPNSAADLRALLAESIIEIRSGKLDPKLANSISYLLIIWLPQQSSTFWTARRGQPQAIVTC